MEIAFQQDHCLFLENEIRVSVTNSRGTPLEVFAGFGPVLPAAILAQLDRLNERYLRMYREEWGEALPRSTLWDTFRSVKTTDSIAFLTTPSPANDLPQLVGSGIVALASREEAAAEINSVLELSQHVSVNTRDIPAFFPEKFLCFIEIWIEKPYRGGVAPLGAMFHGLTQALLRQYPPTTPILFYTKGYSSKHPERLLPIMRFARQANVPTIPLPRIEEHDRYLFWITLGDLAFLSSPPFLKPVSALRILTYRFKRWLQRA